MYEINMLDDKSEIVAYNFVNMPLKSGFSSQEEFPTLQVVNHCCAIINLKQCTEWSALFRRTIQLKYRLMILLMQEWYAKADAVNYLSFMFTKHHLTI